jgi:hypothetical protein
MNERRLVDRVYCVADAEALPTLRAIVFDSWHKFRISITASIVLLTALGSAR